MAAFETNPQLFNGSLDGSLDPISTPFWTDDANPQDDSTQPDSPPTPRRPRVDIPDDYVCRDVVPRRGECPRHFYPHGRLTCEQQNHVTPRHCDLECCVIGRRDRRGHVFSGGFDVQEERARTRRIDASGPHIYGRCDGRGGNLYYLSHTRSRACAASGTHVSSGGIARATSDGALPRSSYRAKTVDFSREFAISPSG